MPNDRDELIREADELEAQLAQDEEQLQEDEGHRHGETPEERMARLGARAMRHLEARKDSPEAMSEAISQKYLALGKDLLRDDSSNRLAGPLRDRVTRLIGRDPGDVRIHTGDRAQAAADALGARAFAVGDGDVYFGRGEFRPHTEEGLGVLVHELAHVADNQMAGAAFHTGSNAASYSAAEERAEAAEAFVTSSPDNDADLNEASNSGQGLEINMDTLEEAVHKIIVRGQTRSMDRTGRSSTNTPNG